MFFQLFLKNLDNYLKAPTSQTEDTLLAGFLQQIGLKIIMYLGEETCSVLFFRLFIYL